PGRRADQHAEAVLDRHAGLDLKRIQRKGIARTEVTQGRVPHAIPGCREPVRRRRADGGGHSSTLRSPGAQPCSRRSERDVDGFAQWLRLAAVLAVKYRRPSSEPMTVWRIG